MDKGLHSGSLSGQVKGLKKGSVKGVSKGLFSGNDRFNNVDVFLCIGDSIGSGLVGHTASALPAQGDALEFDAYTNSVRQFGIQSTNFNNKSPWARFCIDYKTQTSRRPLIINRSSSGSTISPATSIQVGNDWQTSGLNYYPAVNAVRDCLSRVHKKKLKGILVILGINDIQGGNGTGSLTVSQVSGYMTTLIDNLRKDFGTDVPIVLAQCGRFLSDNISTRMTGIRDAWKQKCQTYNNVSIGASLQAFDIAGYYEDGIHPNVLGNDALGSMFARWFKNERYTKWARSIISCHFDDLTEAYKKKINDWMVLYQSVYLQMDMFYQLKTTLKSNAGFDWAFLYSPEDGGFTFNTNADVRTTSTSTLFHLGYNQTETAINVLTNDYGVEVKASVINTASGILAAIIGNITTGTTKATFIRQLNPSGVNYATLSGTSFTDAGETNLVAASWITERVSSGTINLRKDGTIVDTQSDSAVGASAGDWSLGALRTNGVLGQAIDAQFTRVILFRPSLISNYATFLTDLDTLQS